MGLNVESLVSTVIYAATKNIKSSEIILQWETVITHWDIGTPQWHAVISGLLSALECKPHQLNFKNLLHKQATALYTYNIHISSSSAHILQQFCSCFFLLERPLVAVKIFILAASLFESQGSKHVKKVKNTFHWLRISICLWTCNLIRVFILHFILFGQTASNSHTVITPPSHPPTPTAHQDFTEIKACFHCGLHRFPWVQFLSGRSPDTSLLAMQIIRNICVEF